MHLKRIIFTVVVVSALIVMTAQAISACSCGAKPTVLDAFDRSEDVIIAQVKSVEKTGGALYRYKGYRGASMTVQRVFKGNLKIGDELFFEQGGGADCIWTFDDSWIGETVLIYDTPYDGLRFVVACGRSRVVGAATDDLLYLENLERVRGKTRISGEYRFGFSQEPPAGESVAGKSIRITGKQGNYVAVTDKNGVYELYDVPEGEYLISAEIPKGWRIDKYMLSRSPSIDPAYRYSENFTVDRLPIRVEAGKHVSFNFQLESHRDNAITGRIVDPQGAPMKGICVAAVSAEGEDSERGPTDCTNEKGSFTISEVHDEAVVLVINGDGKVDGREPIERLFFPGVSERSKATVIETPMGKKVALRDFKVSKLVETITLRGVLTFADGKPIESKKVQFVANADDPSRLRDPYVYTDEQGRFELKILKGQTGTLRGQMILGERKLAGCPELKGAPVIDDGDGSGVVTVGTEPILIRTDENRLNLKLQFGFPECKID